MKKSFLILLSLISIGMIFLVLYILQSLFSAVTLLFSSLVRVNYSIILLYQENLEYLWVSAFLAVEVYVFISIILRVLPYEVSMDKRRNQSEGNEREVHEIKYERPLYLLVMMIRYSIIMISDFRRVLVGISRGYKRRKEMDLGREFVMSAFIIGVIISISLMLVYGIGQYLFWALFAFYLFSTILYIVALGEVDKLDNKARRELGIWYEDSRFIVSYGTVKTIRIKVEEKIIALGLSIGTGICGVITTLGAAILSASLSFALVPLTFDMLSLISALIEFSGLKVILSIFRDLREIEAGIMTMPSMIFWSLYLIEITRALLSYFNLRIPTNTVLGVIAGTWILLAIALSIVERSMKLTRRMATLVLILSLVVITLLLIM